MGLRSFNFWCGVGNVSVCGVGMWLMPKEYDACGLGWSRVVISDFSM